MRIGHNMVAVFANRAVHNVNSRLEKSIERLATGEQIVRAGDDASGLAVSEKMRTQINGLIQAEKNAENGLSFIQVAEGSFQQVNEILQRLRSLAVQSANGIYSDQDRAQIQVEVSQLIDEIDRIATTAEFNRLKMLDGRFARNSRNPNRADMFFHVGPNSNQRIRVYISTVSARALNMVTGGGQRRSIATVNDANAMIGFVDQGLDRLNRQRADLGAYYNRMEVTMRALAQSYENMMHADSRIRDADMAATMVDFSRDQVLIQTGIAMLAQANMKPQLILKLIE
jgi:flagellin